MNPSDRLWAQLIFPWLPFTCLLACRLVCTSWRKFLEAFPLLKENIFLLPGLRYEERIDGWTGVRRAMAREQRTRDGHNFTISELCGDAFVSMELVRSLLGGRVLLFSSNSSLVFCDGITGKEQCPRDRFVNRHTAVLCDRWVVYWNVSNRLVLKDALHLQTPMQPFGPDNVFVTCFDAAGCHLAVYDESQQNAIIFQLDCRTGSMSVVRTFNNVEHRVFMHDCGRLFSCGKEVYDTQTNALLHVGPHCQPRHTDNRYMYYTGGFFDVRTAQKQSCHVPVIVQKRNNFCTIAYEISPTTQKCYVITDGNVVRVYNMLQDERIHIDDSGALVVCVKGHLRIGDSTKDLDVGRVRFFHYGILVTKREGALRFHRFE